MSAPGTLPTPSEAADNIKALRDFLYQYNTVSENCFTDCVTDFTSRNVSEKEERCTANCLDKYLKMTQRLALRFQEHQLLQQESMGAGSK